MIRTVSIFAFTFLATVVVLVIGIVLWSGRNHEPPMQQFYQEQRR